jgi:hypothetical protein
MVPKLFGIKYSYIREGHTSAALQIKVLLLDCELETASTTFFVRAQLENLKQFMLSVRHNINDDPHNNNDDKAYHGLRQTSPTQTTPLPDLSFDTTIVSNHGDGNTLNGQAQNMTKQDLLTLHH